MIFKVEISEGIILLFSGALVFAEYYSHTFKLRTLFGRWFIIFYSRAAGSK